MKKVLKLYRKCRESDSFFLWVVLRYIFIRVFHGKQLFLHQRVKIKGLKNIRVREYVEIGIGYIGFMHRTDKTFLNVKGKLNMNGKFIIGRGCRFDIGKDAIVNIGNNGFINCNTKLVIQHELTIGDSSGISWDCQVMDEDFHEIKYPGRKITGNGITIGNHVWVGCGVKIYKGTIIPDGCIVAADSMVRGEFKVRNALIGGNPAKVLKEDVYWEW